MRGFANKKVDFLELVRRYLPEQRMHKLQQNSARVFGGKQVSGECGQHAKPQQRGNPRSQLARRRGGDSLMKS
jgi:hypothetical protein